MLKKFLDKSPNINKNTFIAKDADIIGDVTLEENASIWYSAVLRGDTNKIFVGKNSNIQDNCTVHVDNGKNDGVCIGENVTIGHGAIVHGCTIGNNVLIGMGAIILNGAKIGHNTIIGAGSLVTQNKEIPSGVLCLGSPARVIRELTEKEIKSIEESAKHYAELSKIHMIE